MSPTPSTWPGSGSAAMCSRGWPLHWPWRGRRFRRRSTVETCIAAGVLGLGLYATSLRNSRTSGVSLPVRWVLWSSPGWASDYFVGRPASSDRRGRRTSSHYPDHLPWPFRAIRGMGREHRRWPCCRCGSPDTGMTADWRGIAITSVSRYRSRPVWPAGFEPLAAVICLCGLRRFCT